MSHHEIVSSRLTPLRAWNNRWLILLFSFIKYRFISTFSHRLPTLLIDSHLARLRTTQCLPRCAIFATM